MHVEVIEFPTKADQTDKIMDFFRLRRRVFCDQMGWDIPTHDQLEFDQYDTFAATYVIASENNKVVGGCRLLPTTNVIGDYFTYMIKDAYDGKINLPNNMTTDPPPVDPDVWELTRLVVEKPRASLAINKATNDWLVNVKDAKGIIWIASRSLLRLAQHQGWNVYAIGPDQSDASGNFVCAYCILNKE